MAVNVAVVRETSSNERRVALTPEVAKKLKGKGATVLVQSGAGQPASFPDAAYKDAETVADAATTLARADVLFKVQPPTLEEIAQLREGSVVVSLLQPHLAPERTRALRDRKITAFAMELLPRTTRAQAMDVLSSQAGVAGYKAVLIAAEASPKFFPMLTTAAGTIRPSKVLIVGAGVAGLQAIATARRLGAQVEGFDVRPETKEQIESLGAKFLDLGVSAAGSGGYARELTAEEREQQQKALAEHLKGIDVIVTTAAVPGRKAPRIISAAMVEGMKPGAVIVDIAAETGGNVELSEAGKTVVTANGVTIIGPVNLAASAPIHASEMYSRNLYNFIELSLKDGALNLDWDDELIAKTCLTHAGEIRHEATRQLVDGA
ncbi:MAG: NAD(P) transhydrogenase subunit alpha [Lysobacterales bacterium 69-70]|nr:Re/Si-specific NAD(P)(+) transhydrogenase subunit alpha [Xanthomonadaceae bacterium]ODU34516.1 MAG: NAD(P) transhydrogenase subunit alpha [Xanthomonadaceae bacterium SCN 69-320]ODV19553.1 MAG: NAD(P) transhydrogenase subunit alpha [Xanthomonadaceae bacterium SCN 69-25]OJY94763.1 MAG: NAD(P) transhydrogenase subunit alpha [Xanthomonadales bacterium 69-70]